MTPPDDEKDRPPPGSGEGFRAPEALVTGLFLGVLSVALVMLVVSNLDFNLEKFWKYWGDSHGKYDRSVIFRNFGLFFLALVALPLAVWRSWTAHKQAKTSESGLIIDRYQKGAQMLESSELSVRIAGVYALRELALSDPEDVYFQVLDILYAFVREKSKDRKTMLQMPAERGNDLDYGNVPPDLQIALDSCTEIRQSPKGAGIEQRRDWHPDLKNANLSGADLRNAILFGANLNHANLSGAGLNHVNLSGADLSHANMSALVITEANLSGAVLVKANLSGANLWLANLSGANLEKANLSGAGLGFANLSGAKLELANLSGATLAAPNLSGASLGFANLSGMYLELANLSGAELLAVTTDDETKIFRVWAYKPPPSTHMPKQFEKTIAYRNTEESWADFVERMQIERPDLDFDRSVVW